MSIPDYQTLMLPFLKIASDGNDYIVRDAIEILAKQFNLNAEERVELLPSGQQSIFDNRVGWARTYLKKAGLIESPKRGVFKITEKGINVLKSNPEKIDVNFLKQFDEFNEFFNLKKDDDSAYESNVKFKPVETTAINDSVNPEENLEYIIKNLEKQLADDLLERIMQNSPAFFENLVASLLLKMGYGNSKQDILQNRGKSGDEGIDGIIKEDVLGLDKIYVQAKRWQGTIGRPKIQEFVGAIDNKTHKGVFITTSSFSSEAIEYAAGKPSIVLIDGKKLTELMIKYNLGVSIKQEYQVKRIDEDFFID
jgi:restriction system protein